MSRSTFLTVPRMAVANANLMQAWWFAAAPGPMAALGFAHNLARHLGTTELGVGLVHHDLQMLAEDLEFVLRPHQFRSAEQQMDKTNNPKYGKSLAAQPTFRGHLKTSLVIELPEGTVNDAVVARFLATARFAGGQVNKHGRVAEHETLAEAQKYLRSGFAVCDRTELMEEALHQGQDQLDALLELTKAGTMADAPWRMPAVLGYTTLTPIATRDLARENYPHAYAEPLVGLVQYCPLREGLPLWRYARPSESVFLATARS